MNPTYVRGVWACMKHERQMRAQGSGAIVNCCGCAARARASCTASRLPVDGGYTAQ
jgi:hypothetical protein